MSRKIRVLIVDDSSVVRKLLTQALEQHPQVVVVGTAANGILALSQVAQLEPDAVVLDIEMPEMDGIATLIKLRKTHAQLPVIMFSTLTERGANVTFDALAAGASDYVLKPSVNRGESLDAVVANCLVPKLLALVRSGAVSAKSASNTVPERGTFDSPTTGRKLLLKPSAVSPRASSPTFAPTKLAALSTDAQRGASVRPAAFGNTPSQVHALPVKLANPPRASQRAAPGAFAQPVARARVHIIAIAASTGGPNALAEVLSRIPGALPVPIVVVQHMPPIFTRCLADRLSSRCELKVLECGGGELLAPGAVYIAPGNRHLELHRDGEGVHTLLTDGPHENSCRPSADVLFRSVARAYGSGVLGVVLTGMGQDGARGAREIREAGGRVVVQSGPTCVVWGMPKVVEEAGLAEAVVPLPEMAAAILQRIGLGLTPLRSPGGTP